MNDKLMDMLLEQEEVGWKTILMDLVKTEQMDPWDINITLLTQKYIETIKKLQEHDLRISGKILLAAAILLKIKSTHLVENDISKLDALINQSDEVSDEDLFEIDETGKTTRLKEQYQLIPRNPQPRNRKVSIHDLVEALQRAMASKKRILSKIRPTPFIMPHRKVDILEVIRDIYHKIQYYSNKEEDITFTKLLPAKAGRQEKVYTFIPLLHLENEQRVEMHQQKPFEEIKVTLLGKVSKAKVK